MAPGNLVITGDTLEMYGYNASIECGLKVLIYECEVYSHGNILGAPGNKGEILSALIIYHSNVTIKNSDIRIPYNGGCVNGWIDIIFEQCAMTYPENAYIGYKNIEVDGETVMSKIIIKKDKYYTRREKMGAGGYATIAMGGAQGTVSDNVEVFTARMSDSKVVLIPRADRNLPPGACVVLKDKPGDTYAVVNDTTVVPSPMPGDNALTGGNYYTVTEDDNIFALSTIDDVTAFYRVSAGVVFIKNLRMRECS